MPDDSKKSHDKKKNDPKEQRKPRNSRNQGGKAEKKIERVEEPKFVPKVTVPQKPPVYEDPGPEFYKSLKRETEEILKINEEENSKYKKKEIQSNWSKYEMPIESYEEIEEHDTGADYEKLIQAPLSIGGHFQFKHEKSWDVNTGPTLYDKYFEINMGDLSLSVSTVPFYERNGVDQSLFSETDMLSMNNRATRYKQKYYDDKSYSTPETEAQDKILNSLKESLSENKVETDSTENENYDIITESNAEDRSQGDDINLDFKSTAKTDNIPRPENIKEKVTDGKFVESKVSNERDIAKIDVDIVLECVPKIKPPILQDENITNVIHPPKELPQTQSIEQNIIKSNDLPRTVSKSTKIETKPKDNADKKRTPVIESPEDLEKWLDDFLDG